MARPWQFEVDGKGEEKWQHAAASIILFGNSKLGPWVERLHHCEKR